MSEGSSGVLWFFRPDNWEMLIKVLDGCSINQRFWVLAAATTDVGYELRVRDTSTGRVASYTNPLGQVARALIDVEALDTCSEGGAPAEARVATPSASVGARGSVRSVQASDCVAGANVLCLGGGRFRVEVEWRDFQDNVGTGSVAPFLDDSSGLFWFFSPENWEMLVKVLNGCALNDSFWVFFGATTNVGFTLRVTDLESGEVAVYENDLGHAADTVADTAALPCALAAAR